MDDKPFWGLTKSSESRQLFLCLSTGHLPGKTLSFKKVISSNWTNSIPYALVKPFEKAVVVNERVEKDENTAGPVCVYTRVHVNQMK
jgi:hypothetical protein